MNDWKCRCGACGKKFGSTEAWQKHIVKCPDAIIFNKVLRVKNEN